MSLTECCLHWCVSFNCKLFTDWCFFYSTLFLNQQRLKTDEYEDIDTFSADINLLFDNAIKFYKADAQEHKDAIKLKEVFDDAKARLCSQMDKGKLFNWASSQFKVNKC